MSSRFSNSRRFAVISDVHCGPDAETRPGRSSLGVLEQVVSALSREEISFVVDLGDRINDVDEGTDRVNLQALRRVYSKLRCPVFMAYGNHDIVNLAKEEQNRILGKSGSFEFSDIDGDLRVVVLDSVDPPFDGVGGSVSSGQLDWLGKSLSEGRQTLVFTHHPIVEQEVDFHWYFATHPEHSCVSNRAELTEVLSRGNCVAVFNGHMHWMTQGRARGIPVVTVPSLVDTTLTGHTAPGLFTVAELHDSTLRVEHRTPRGIFLERQVELSR